MSRTAALLLPIACGFAVANVYLAQPLLDLMADELGIRRALAGLAITATQAGYGLGLLLLAPLGDAWDPRRLAALQFLLSAAALFAVAAAPSAALLLCALAGVGALAVVAQVLVAHAARLAAAAERGRAIGRATSGIVLGILLARTLAGALADRFGWRTVYLASSALAVLLAGLLYRALPRGTAVRGRIPYRRLIASGASLFAAEPLLRVRSALALLSFCAAAMLLTPLALRLAGPPFWLSRTQIGLFGLAGLAGALGARGAGRLADRGEAQWTTATGLTLMLASWLPSALCPASLWALALGVAASDVGLQAIHVSNLSLIDRVQPDARTRIAAVYMLCYAVGLAAGAIGSTLVFARAGWPGVCGAGATLSALALGFWAATRRSCAAPCLLLRGRPQGEQPQGLPRTEG